MSFYSKEYKFAVDFCTNFSQGDPEYTFFCEFYIFLSPFSRVRMVLTSKPFSFLHCLYISLPFGGGVLVFVSVDRSCAASGSVASGTVAIGLFSGRERRGGAAQVFSRCASFVVVSGEPCPEGACPHHAGADGAAGVGTPACRRARPHGRRRPEAAFDRLGP